MLTHPPTPTPTPTHTQATGRRTARTTIAASGMHAHADAVTRNLELGLASR